MLITTESSLFTLPLHRTHGQYKAVLGFSSIPFRGLLATKEAYLHEREMAEYNGLSNARKQQAFLQGRYLAKKVVAAYAGEAAARSIRIQNGVFGQPLVRYRHDLALGISIAHTTTVAACLAFPDEHPMGVDVERISHAAAETIRSQMTWHENRLPRTGGEAENVFYTRLWTIKEALSKVLKTGLLTPFDVYEIATISQLAKECTISTFTNFNQYKALSFPWQDAVCSVVLPKETTCPFPEQFM